MANIKDLKKRIQSIKNTLKITTAMKLVASAKMARAQAAIRMSRPYSQELEDTIDIISTLIEDYEHHYFKDTGAKKVALLVISSDRGLCGSYNSQLAKATMEFIKKTTDLEIDVFFVGKKVKEIIGKKVRMKKFFQFAKRGATPQEFRKVSKELGRLFSTPEYSRLYVAYNVFKSTISSEPTVRQVLPFEEKHGNIKEIQKKYPFDFKYEPGAHEILDALIPEVYLNTMHTCLLDALAAEHSSRMTAMDSASKNCKDAIKVKTIEMNKVRQAGITTELSEIVSGAESLKG